MSTLRQVCAATILSLTIAVSAASAGDLHAPGRATTGTDEKTGTSTTSVTTPVILMIVSLIYR